MDNRSDKHTIHIRDAHLTIPNLLTLIRILLTPAFVTAFIDQRIVMAWVLFVIAGLTDALDGFLAKVLKQRTWLGAVLDPLADKALLVTAYVCLAIKDWVPSWLTILVVSRDIIIVGGLAVLHLMGVELRSRIHPTRVSKLTTVAQIGFIFFVMLEKSFDWDCPDVRMVLAVCTGLLTLASGLHYLLVGLTLLPNGPGNGAAGAKGQNPARPPSDAPPGP